jgi:DNA helicase-2/ATP-dependent DNA helicase PcrA
MNSKLTAEQDAVVRHPLEAHARVLAVAGAGKTTTMVHRVKYLVERFTILPSAICILMFNRRARIQFKEKLNALLPSERQPQVHTFHSYSYSLISEAVARGYLANIQNAWVGDKEELTRIHIHSAITNLVRRKEIPPDSIDPDDAVECIGLWKNSLIPPDRAGHSTSQLLPRVYQEFERIRIEKNALTYDDFVPLAVGILEAEPAISHQVINSFDAIIVDEYQDVNFGQQRLIELIAGQRADIMVVGDDDQTIYEWRGARPRYIIGEFNRVFGNKPNLDYKLSRSFRFGPIIAQAAQNVISFNSERVTKPLIAHAGGREAAIYVVNNTSEQPTDVNKELAAQVVALVRETRDAQNIIVL